jgi:hypothetical protein
MPRAVASPVLRSALAAALQGARGASDPLIRLRPSATFSPGEKENIFFAGRLAARIGTPARRTCTPERSPIAP